MDIKMLEAIQGMNTNELRDFTTQLHRALDKVSEEMQSAKEDPNRKMRKGAAGSPRDTAVQRLAARELRRLKMEMGLSFAEIGDIARVSRERARVLFKKLCPLEYDTIKNEKKSRAQTPTT